ncbi:MAG: hypothetical protein Ct9H300mP12_08500 [Acidimicrobiales bacterium]|nr:MAG: hypothetical protein Ct9H300mP12_08500 [Acidimicrobiales bacterium]
MAEALFALALLGVHLSRIGEEMILWSTAEFGYGGPLTTLSPRDRHASAEEEPGHRRAGPGGKAGRLIGHLTGLLTTLKGLPLAYNKDLQEDKEPLFDACDTVRLTLLALDGMVSTLELRTDRMAKRLTAHIPGPWIWPSSWSPVVPRSVKPTLW